MRDKVQDETEVEEETVVENVDDGVSEGIDFYNGRKTYKAVFKLRETHTVTLTLVGKVRSTYWSAGGQMVPAPESYTIITEVE